MNAPAQLRPLLLALAAATGAAATPPAAPTQAVVVPPPALVDSVALAPLVVTATRAPRSADELPFAVDVVSAERLRDSPALTLDDALRDSAAFSLFRRSGSLTANPTAQGVSLRGLGPSGASRSLVLLDGVPLNDPFGGWVAWSKVPRAGLDHVEIVRGGGSGSWGNAALGGTIQILSGEPANHFQAGGGAGDTWNTEFTVARAAGPGTLALGGRAFGTGGFFALAPADRGPVDRPLDSAHRLVHAAWHQDVGPATQAGVTARVFTEERGNGTALQRNRSREAFVAGFAAGRPSRDFSWRTDAYFQRQRFASYFSTVNATRTAETPANNQYRVPSTAAGASAQATWRHAGDATTVVGGDARWVAGETREEFLFAGGRLTRRREAGGDQAFAGLFANHSRRLAPAWHVTAAARVDAWRNTDGHRRETDLATGALVRNDAYPARAGTEFSPQLGLVWQPAPALRWRASAYRAFRVPTLNEYYRPFRVGLVNTEANPALRRESVLGAETGVEFAGRRLRVAATVFHNDLDDAVANVTLARTPTLISRQRQNLDRLRVRGLELTAEWTPRPEFRLRADWLWDDARVRTAAAQPALAGRRLPQVPRHTLALQADWRVSDKVRAVLRGRHAGEQFEDDENTLALAAATTVDARVSRQLPRGWEAFAAVENLGDARIETGRSNEGVATLGTPRLWRVGLERSW